MIFLHIDSLKWETPNSSRKTERYLGIERIYLNPEYISTISDGRELEINGVITKTAYVILSEENSFRVPYSADDFVQHLQHSYEAAVAEIDLEMIDEEDDDNIVVEEIEIADEESVC